MRLKIFFVLCFLSFNNILAQKQKIWFDTDMGNEMDDIYAISRLLVEADKFNIVGVSSAHFINVDLMLYDKWNQYPTKDINTVKISQEENEKILTAFNKMSIPHPMGVERIMGRAWGEYTPRPSEVTNQIINVVKGLADGEKLDILFIGAATNIASAIALEPSITPKIRLFSMAARYDAKEKVWDKNEFNVRGDLNAFNFLMNNPTVEWYVMPAQTCEVLTFEREDTYARLDAKYPVENLLKQRWIESNPDDKTRIIWDLALVEAYLSPELAKVKSVKTPPENHQHKVNVYVKIDREKMFNRFWEKLRAYRAK
ncbi:MAG: nucleoside hydrolase [Arcicella sp.]|jgi:inosine-uridine nucleoside N-ribohydrolase|nr:nucleoside hydrolase [Arcicella sp.]